MSNIKVGMTLPDFELPDENGELHHLSDLQGSDAMVLHLARGEHCPRERQHHFELLRFARWCPVAFTQIVSIFPGVKHDTYKMKIATGAEWTFLADEELRVREALEIDEYTDTHHDYAVVPHTLILSPGLKVEKVYVGYWFWGRPSPEQLWSDLGALFVRTQADFDPTTAEARAAWEAEQAPAPA
jgi:peroxiredoxin